MQLGSEVIVAITDDGNGIDLDEILVVIEKNLRPLSFTPGMRRDPAPACRRGRGSDRWRSPLRGRVLGQDPGFDGPLVGGHAAWACWRPQPRTFGFPGVVVELVLRSPGWGTSAAAAMLIGSH